MSKSIKDILENARADGRISQEAVDILTVTDIGVEIQNALGVSVDDVGSSEVILVTALIDDSGSMNQGDNARITSEGHNALIDELLKAKQSGGVLVHTRYIHGKILYPYGFLKDAKKMDGRNYKPDGGTPLYDQIVTALGSVFVKSQEFFDAGVSCRTITLIVSDGAENESRIYTNPASVRKIVEDMLKEERHIIAAMGIDDGATDFKKVFSDLGIQSKWILTPVNNGKEIREAFRLFSQSAVRASQSVQSFSQTSVGGFGAP